MSAKEFKALINPNAVFSTNANSQRMRAMRLQKDVGISMTKPVAVTELVKYERHLNVQIVVISGDEGNAIIYKGFKPMKDKIYLYLKTQHYHSIVNIKGFFVNKTLCTQCLTVYKRGAKHSCKFVCRTCERSNCVYDEESHACPDCNLICRNAECFVAHKEPREYTVGAKRGEERLSLCETYYRCKKCTKILDITKRDLESHQCGEWFCTCCSEFVVGEHLCYYRIRKPKSTSGRFLFYDFETSQDTVMTCEKGYANRPKDDCGDCIEGQLCAACRKCRNCHRSYCGLQQHIPNYVVCHSACDFCKDEDFTPASECARCGDRCATCCTRDKDGFAKPPCANGKCGRRERVFKGINTTHNFCQWLIAPQHRDTVVIAHNAKAFDSHFILGYCVENGIFPDVVYSGSKIMTMTIGEGLGMRFIDSLNFLPMALKKLPQALSLKQGLTKGQFPHFFNKAENWNFKAQSHPAAHFYGPDDMSKADREEFLAWYAENKDKPFDFQTEILSYTRADVAILREACMKFRDLILDVTTFEDSRMPGVDPFAHATIASSAMQIIRQLMLHEEHDVTLLDGRKGRGVLKRGQWTFEGESIEEDQIAETKFVKSPIPQIPVKGYGKHANDSEKAAIWLEWTAHKSSRHIQHSRNGGEYCIPGTRYHVDGFHEPTKTVYEFLGCYFHGHTCIKDRNKMYDKRTNSSFQSIYQRTMLRLQQIRNKGYTTVVKWECEYDAMLRSSEEFARFAATCDTVRPLKIRDSFFGGRVSPVKLFYEAAEDERIRYLDVTSLYPFINLTGRYPTDHPQIIRDNIDPTLESYYGLAKVKILPPRGLYIPVLPVRCEGKLLFPLCNKCSKLQNSENCTCTPDERALVGTWTTPEISAAVASGYEIVKVYEVYHFAETSTDPSGPGNIFQGYLELFLKVKQESSGYPSWVQSEEDKDRYIQYYFENQGIKLDKNKIAYNASLRLISKIYANSAWGKFIQRCNMEKSMYVKSTADLATVRNDPTKRISDFHIINEEYMVLEYYDAESFEEQSTFTNEILGTFTTSLARLHLLKILQTTGRNTLYFDTDSVVFVEKVGQQTLHTGDLLGQLTDELPQGRFIKLFMSTGPKSYSYRLDNNVTTMKIKGITLNHKNSQVIDFDMMKSVVFDAIEKVRLPPSKQITRVKHRGIVYNRPQSKLFRKVFSKRVMIPGSYDSLPYGY